MFQDSTEPTTKNGMSDVQLCRVDPLCDSVGLNGLCLIFIKFSLIFINFHKIEIAFGKKRGLVGRSEW